MNNDKAWQDRTLHGLARAGYAARGLVYLALSVVAALAAIGAAQPSGDQGILRRVFELPLGSVLLVIIIGGVIGYVLWRLAQAVLDVDDHGHGVKALTIRAGLLVSALSYLALAGFALTLLTGWSPAGGSSGGGGSGDWTAWLLRQPYGAWVLGGVAACVGGAGIAVAIKGARAGFQKWMVLSDTPVHWLTPVCRFGLITRGIILIATGVFLAATALDVGAPDTQGLKSQLEWLQDQPHGLPLLLLAAAGLLAFGIYSSLEAVYRDLQGFDE